MRAVANKKLPTIVVLDPARSLELRWWSLQGMPVAVTFFTSSAEESMNLAATYGVDLFVIQLPVDGLSVTDLMHAVRRTNSAVRFAVVVSSELLPGDAEIDGCPPDFMATESIDFTVLAAVFKKLVAEARGGTGDFSRKGTAA